MFYVQSKVSFSKIIYKHLETTTETASIWCSFKKAAQIYLEQLSIGFPEILMNFKILKSNNL